MKACKAVRTVAHSAVDYWRVVGHQHGVSCGEVVVAQAPVGPVVRRDGRPVVVSLRVRRS